MISRSGRYSGWGRSALLSFSVCLLNNLTCGQWWIHDLALSSSSSSTWIPHILPSSHLPFFAPITDPSSASRTSVIKKHPRGQLFQYNWRFQRLPEKLKCGLYLWKSLPEPWVVFFLHSSLSCYSESAAVRDRANSWWSLPASSLSSLPSLGHSRPTAGMA